MDHIAVLDSWSRDFTAVVAGALDRPVPACPGWTVDDLVAHVADVQASWRFVVENRGAEPDWALVEAAADTGPDRVAGWTRISNEYVAAQRAADPSASVWCWWNDEKQTTAGEVARRQAHEIVVHGADARLAVGLPVEIPAAVAADGVDEFLERFLNGPDWAGEPVVVELRGPERSWFVAAGPDKPHGVSPRPADVVVSGTVQDLYLLLWRRVPLSGLTVEGEEERATAVLGWADLD